MADIKTRDAVKGTIKTLDKAAIAGRRMKSAYAKTKDKAEQGYYAEENSPTEYAADKVSHASGRIKDEGMQMRWSFPQCRHSGSVGRSTATRSTPPMCCGTTHTGGRSQAAVIKPLWRLP